MPLELAGHRSFIRPWVAVFVLVIPIHCEASEADQEPTKAECERDDFRILHSPVYEWAACGSASTDLGYPGCCLNYMAGVFQTGLPRRKKPGARAGSLMGVYSYCLPGTPPSLMKRYQFCVKNL